MTTTMQRGVFAVQTIDADTGKESEVRVEATGREEAIGKVASLGAIVGACRLVEVAGNAPPAVPGLVTCPKCGGTEWEDSRGVGFWICVVIFFPLGLLLLLITPSWTCRSCQFSYQSSVRPASIYKPTQPGSETPEPEYTGAAWSLVRVIVVGFALSVLAVAIYSVATQN